MVAITGGGSTGRATIAGGVLTRGGGPIAEIGGADIAVIGAGGAVCDEAVTGTGGAAARAFFHNVAFAPGGPTGDGRCRIGRHTGMRCAGVRGTVGRGTIAGAVTLVAGAAGADTRDGRATGAICFVCIRGTGGGGAGAGIGDITFAGIGAADAGEEGIGGAGIGAAGAVLSSVARTGDGAALVTGGTLGIGWASIGAIAVFRQVAVTGGSAALGARSHDRIGRTGVPVARTIFGGIAPAGDGSTTFHTGCFVRIGRARVRGPIAVFGNVAGGGTAAPRGSGTAHVTGSALGIGGAGIGAIAGFEDVAIAGGGPTGSAGGDDGIRRTCCSGARAVFGDVAAAGDGGAADVAGGADGIGGAGAGGTRAGVDDIAIAGGGPTGGAAGHKSTGSAATRGRGTVRSPLITLLASIHRPIAAVGCTGGRSEGTGSDFCDGVRPLAANSDGVCIAGRSGCGNGNSTRYADTGRQRPRPPSDAIRSEVHIFDNGVRTAIRQGTDRRIRRNRIGPVQTETDVQTGGGVAAVAGGEGARIVGGIGACTGAKTHRNHCGLGGGGQGIDSTRAGNALAVVTYLNRTVGHAAVAVGGVAVIAGFGPFYKTVAADGSAHVGVGSGTRPSGFQQTVIGTAIQTRGIAIVTGFGPFSESVPADRLACTGALGGEALIPSFDRGARGVTAVATGRVGIVARLAPPHVAVAAHVRADAVDAADGGIRRTAVRSRRITISSQGTWSRTHRAGAKTTAAATRSAAASGVLTGRDARKSPQRHRECSHPQNRHRKNCRHRPPME